jgi:hypothetical protein
MTMLTLIDANILLHWVISKLVLVSVFTVQNVHQTPVLRPLKSPIVTGRATDSVKMVLQQLGEFQIGP